MAGACLPSRAPARARVDILVRVGEGLPGLVHVLHPYRVVGKQALVREDTVMKMVASRWTKAQLMVGSGRRLTPPAAKRQQR